jgi:hypothetical protein
MDDVYIKKEGGKEVVYKRGFFSDYKVGPLHETVSGTKETLNIAEPTVKVHEAPPFSDKRPGEVGGKKGYFSKEPFQKGETFKPEKPSTKTVATSRQTIDDRVQAGNSQPDSSYQASAYKTQQSESYSESKDSKEKSSFGGLVAKTLLLAGIAAIALLSSDANKGK